MAPKKQYHNLGYAGFGDEIMGMGTASVADSEQDNSVVKAEKLSKQLADNTSFLRGSSSNYRKMEAALKAYQHNRDSEAVYSAAYNYLEHKVGKDFRTADLSKFNSYEKKRIQSAMEVLNLVEGEVAAKRAEEKRQREEAAKAKAEQERESAERLAAARSAPAYTRREQEPVEIPRHTVDHINDFMPQNPVAAVMKQEALASAALLEDHGKTMTPEQLQKHVTNINAFRAGKPFFESMPDEMTQELRSLPKAREYIDAIKDSYRQAAGNAISSIETTEDATKVIKNNTYLANCATVMRKSNLKQNEALRSKGGDKAVERALEEKTAKRQMAQAAQNRQKQQAAPGQKRPAQKQRKKDEDVSIGN